MMRKGLSNALLASVGFVTGIVSAWAILGKAQEEYGNKVDKFKSYYYLMNQWLSLKNNGGTVEKYFSENNIRTVALYGMGEVGNRLYEELKGKIEVKYAIDKNCFGQYEELEVKRISDDLQEVDAVVVTIPFAYEEIMVEISDKFSCPIISIEDIVYE